MRKFILLLVSISALQQGMTQQNDYSKYPVYKGADLGATYSVMQTAFKVWAPTASQVRLLINDGKSDGYTTRAMLKEKEGAWSLVVKGDLQGQLYAYQVQVGESWKDPAVDPYAKSVGVNGRWGMIIDLKKTNPADWAKDKSPVFSQKTDAIIYELHVRDASISPNSGIKQKGKYLGLTEKGTKNTAGLSTGLDHIMELGGHACAPAACI
jgi:1,4-alpha-glucan branching enzyme